MHHVPGRLTRAPTGKILGIIGAPIPVHAVLPDVTSEVARSLSQHQLGLLACCSWISHTCARDVLHHCMQFLMLTAPLIARSRRLPHALVCFVKPDDAPPDAMPAHRVTNARSTQTLWMEIVHVTSLGRRRKMRHLSQRQLCSCVPVKQAMFRTEKDERRTLRTSKSMTGAGRMNLMSKMKSVSRTARTRAACLRRLDTHLGACMRRRRAAATLDYGLAWHPAKRTCNSRSLRSSMRL